MPVEPIRSDGAPRAVGPYSQGTRAGPWIYTSGQIPLTPSGDMIGDDAGAAVSQALDNVRSILTAAGASMDDVVHVTLYLRDMDDFTAVNEAYAAYFAAVPPSRSCVGVARLPKDARLEIEAVAWVGP